MKNINKAEALHMLLQIERSEEHLNARCELIDLTPEDYETSLEQLDEYIEKCGLTPLEYGNKDMEDLLDVEEVYSQGYMMLRKFLTSKILEEMN